MAALDGVPAKTILVIGYYLGIGSNLLVFDPSILPAKPIVQWLMSDPELGSYLFALPGAGLLLELLFDPLPLQAG